MLTELKQNPQLWFYMEIITPAAVHMPVLLGHFLFMVFLRNSIIRFICRGEGINKLNPAFMYFKEVPSHFITFSSLFKFIIVILKLPT